MSAIAFTQVKDRDGNIPDNQLKYTDADGVDWMISDANWQWQLYLDWVAEGNTAAPPPVEQPVAPNILDEQG